MALARDTFCSYCGHSYGPVDGYPRTCARCGTAVWANPLPVAVVLLPVRQHDRTGLLVVRRAVPPGLGLLGLVGGFVEEHESWQAGAAREVREEADVVVDPDRLAPFWFASSRPVPHRVMLFSVAPAVDATDLPPYVGDAETSERGAVFGPDGLADVFAFQVQTEAAGRYFAGEQISGPHGYSVL
ncbi:hypothetical protein GCM10010124_09290 [Pilimelia terevasa]|uniref:Nudix hydrolase domain-containing protein n=1 Tax=Pilimelia terevasa TaxID=53372 RepID=A0A8J3BG33_9ACTN|nr:NUDIX domain-containing protein [Pilimelia terevasa]GGK18806.1 hypothetical protein GCM10010124_09290 [Pilimelia terevasa]